MSDGYTEPTRLYIWVSAAIVQASTCADGLCCVGTSPARLLFSVTILKKPPEASRGYVGLAPVAGGFGGRRSAPPTRISWGLLGHRGHATSAGLFSSGMGTSFAGFCSVFDPRAFLPYTLSRKPAWGTSHQPRMLQAASQMRLKISDKRQGAGGTTRLPQFVHKTGALHV